MGGRKNPIWRVVVADQRSPRDGRIIETVGRYNAQTDPSEIVLDADRLTHWLDRGAQPTSTVKKLMRTQGIGGIGGGATGGSPAVTADDEPATPAADGEAAVSPDAAPEPEADAPSAADTTPKSPEPEASTASEAPAPDATGDADPAEAPDDGSATESPSTS